MKNLIIINSHINTPEKEEILFQSVQQLKKLGLEILLTSNSILTERVLTLCDYYIYDKENILLPPERSPINWFADTTETIHLFNKGIGYPIIRKLNLALHFAKNLQFDNFFFTEYDSIFHDEDLPKIMDMLSLQDKKGFFCKVYENELWLETRIFSGNVNFFLESIPLPATYDQWISTYPYESATDTLEYIFPLLFQQHMDKLNFFDGYNKDYFTNSEIDIFSINQEMNIVYNTEDPLKPILFLVGTNKTYEVYINDTLVDTVHLYTGQRKKYRLDIKEELIVNVKHNSMQRSFKISKDNIKDYKHIARRYKL